MVLQRLEGLSDREAVDRYCFDNRWRYAAGVGGYDGDGWGRFAHTVLGLVTLTGKTALATIYLRAMTAKQPGPSWSTTRRPGSRGRRSRPPSVGPTSRSPPFRPRPVRPGVPARRRLRGRHGGRGAPVLPLVLGGMVALLGAAVVVVRVRSRPASPAG